MLESPFKNPNVVLRRGKDVRVRGQVVPQLADQYKFLLDYGRETCTGVGPINGRDLLERGSINGRFVRR